MDCLIDRLILCGTQLDDLEISQIQRSSEEFDTSGQTKMLRESSDEVLQEQDSPDESGTRTDSSRPLSQSDGSTIDYLGFTGPVVDWGPIGEAYKNHRANIIPNHLGLGNRCDDWAQAGEFRKQQKEAARLKERKERGAPKRSKCNLLVEDTW
jgi:hypothetical protein